MKRARIYFLKYGIPAIAIALAGIATIFFLKYRQQVTNYHTTILADSSEVPLIKECITRGWRVGDVQAKICSEVIWSSSKRFRVPWKFVTAIIAKESNFNTMAFNNKTNSGKIDEPVYGLMQIKASTARQRADTIGVIWLGEYQLYDPYQNVTFGTDYLEDMWKLANWSFEGASKAYNAGPHNYFARNICNEDYWQGVKANLHKIDSISRTIAGR